MHAKNRSRPGILAMQANDIIFKGYTSEMLSREKAIALKHVFPNVIINLVIAYVFAFVVYCISPVPRLYCPAFFRT